MCSLVLRMTTLNIQGAWVRAADLQQESSPALLTGASVAAQYSVFEDWAVSPVRPTVLGTDPMFQEQQLRNQLL